MSFRTALAAQLADALNIDFVDGYLGGVQGERDLGCTFPVADTPWDEHFGVETVRVGVRVWLQYDRSEEPEQPIDPAPLEAVAATIKATVRAHEKDPAFAVWQSQLLGVDYDAERNMLEAVVMGFDSNPATVNAA